MGKLEKFLKNRLADAKKIAVLGIGSDLRGDDGAGVLAAQILSKKIAGKGIGKRLKVFIGETAPENLTGEIRKFGPSCVIMIDTIESRNDPGTILVLDPGEIGGGVSFSTHKMPAKVLADYFTKSSKCDIIVIGIQPRTLEFGSPVSKTVKDSAKSIASAILKSIGK